MTTPEGRRGNALAPSVIRTGCQVNTEAPETEAEREQPDAPAGTYVFVPDPGSHRHAVATEVPATVLSFGGPPTFEPSDWEWGFRAAPLMRSDPAQAREILERGVRERARVGVAAIQPRLSGGALRKSRAGARRLADGYRAQAQSAGDRGAGRGLRLPARRRGVPKPDELTRGRIRWGQQFSWSSVN
jgi:hypothetical protein